MLPLEGSAPPPNAPPELPLDEPFVAYRRDERAAEAYFVMENEKKKKKISEKVKISEETRSDGGGCHSPCR